MATKEKYEKYGEITQTIRAKNRKSKFQPQLKLVKKK